MAESCGLVCMKEETLKFMNEKITNGETSTKDILKIVSDIKEGYSDTKFALLTIKNTQEIQATNDRDNKDLFMDQFKIIKAQAAAEKLKIEHEKEKATENKIIADADEKNDKRKTRNAIYVAIAVVVANTLIGLAVKYGG